MLCTETSYHRLTTPHAHASYFPPRAKTPGKSATGIAKCRTKRVGSLVPGKEEGVGAEAQREEIKIGMGWLKLGRLSREQLGKPFMHAENNKNSSIQDRVNTPSKFCPAPT